MEEKKPDIDNTRKIITMIIVSVTVGVLGYLAAMVESARQEALVLLGSGFSTAITFYLGNRK